jgi:predicted RNase H-like HicB family nuclease
MNVKYAVIFERAESNCAAYVPGLPDCMTTGRTLEETRANMGEAIEGHFETLRAFGHPIPPPSSLSGEVEVTTAA